MTSLTACCNRSPTSWGSTPRLTLTRCESCGTLWPLAPLPGNSAKPWSESDITPEFASALQLRRKKQAREILRHFGDVLRKGPVLDYGCGQGSFVEELL